MRQNPQVNFTRAARVVLLILGILLLLLSLSATVVYRSKVQPVRDEYFMDREVVLVGTAENLATLLGDLQDIDPNIELTLDPERSLQVTIGSNELEATSEQAEPDVTEIALQIRSESAACNQLSVTLEFNVYELTGSTDDVEAVLAAIDEANTSENVRADANWVIGAPWSPTGSPWSPTGSPWSPTGSADQGQPMPADMNDYLNQWAFKTVGVDDVQTAVDGQNLSLVRVGVFDTSPLREDESGPEGIPSQQPQQNALRVGITNPNFMATPVPPEPGSREDIDVANHGYFGTSFIRELSPGSQIQLIRVLTKNNRGDLATLNLEILKFLGQLNEDVINGEEINAVINMSLGVPPLEPFRPFEPLLDWEFPVPFKLERQLNSLETIMQIGECVDVVMVAAAGNDSAESLKVSNYPANWGTVLSVTSSNQANEQSCYANDGDIAAPGGDGGPSEEGAKNPIACEPKLHLCPSLGPNCPYSVIGYVHLQTSKPEEENITHHHWVGTSFATPMVSGLAALVRQLHPELSAAEVREVIWCGTTKPTTPQQVPVINVAQTLRCAEDLGNVE